MIWFLQVLDLVMLGIRNDQVVHWIMWVGDRCGCVVYWAVHRLIDRRCGFIHHRLCRCIHRFGRGVHRFYHRCRCVHWFGRYHRRCGVDNGCFGAGVAIGRCRCVGLSCVLDGFALIKNFSLKIKSIKDWPWKTKAHLSFGK